MMSSHVVQQAAAREIADRQHYYVDFHTPCLLSNSPPRLPSSMRFTALSVVAFLAGADAFGVSSQHSIRKPAFTSSTAVQGVKNPPANESTPAKALVSEALVWW